MKTTISLPALAFRCCIALLAFIHFACANPAIQAPGGVTGLDEPGALLVRFEKSDVDRSAEPETWRENVEAYELVLSGDQAMGPVIIPETEILLENLPVGTYTITCTATDAEGSILAAGSVSDFDVTGEEGQEVDLALQPVMGGEGIIDIIYDWTGAGFTAGYVSHVIATLAPLGGTPRAIAVDIGENGLIIRESLPSGTYVISCELYAGGLLVSTVSEELQVFDGLETESSLVLEPTDFESPPIAPSPVPARQEGLSVLVNWVDTGDMESGYRVYRSADGSDFELIGDDIPANSTSWIDTPVEPGKDYVYRVVAINDFGESPAADIPVSVDPLVEAPLSPVLINEGAIIGSADNSLDFSILTEGFVNHLNRSSLTVISASVSGGGNVKIAGNRVILDLSGLPFEAEEEELTLDYRVHISGEPLNSTYTADGTARITLQAPEVEEVEEDDLLNPVTAFIYTDRVDLERKMRTYEPPDSSEIFENWGRIVGLDYFTDGTDAENASRSKGDNADLALHWKLKQDSGGSYIEYAKNSVYAGFVSPDSLESDTFTLQATVSSKDDDDDVVGLIVAYAREGDVNYVLEAARSHGADSGGRSLEPVEGWGLLVRRLEPGGDELGDVIWSRQKDVDGIGSRGWSGAESRLQVIRDGDSLTILASDWDNPEVFAADSEIHVDLSSHKELIRFRGDRKFGYFVASQERSAFRDLVIDTGYVDDKLFLLDMETGESEVWWYDVIAGRWIPVSGTSIQDTVGYPIEITNPETGETFLVERKRIRSGSWRDLWNRWSSWRDWAVETFGDRRPRDDDD